MSVVLAMANPNPAVALTSTVFTAFTGSIAAVNTVSGWVENLESFIQKCGEARGRILDILNGIRFCMNELDRWQLKWKLSSITTAGWQTELWGRDMTIEIREKMTDIESKCSELKSLFKSIL